MKPEDLTIIEVQYNAQNMCTPTNAWQTIKSVCYRHAHVKKICYRQTLFYMGKEERMAEKKTALHVHTHIYKCDYACTAIFWYSYMHDYIQLCILLII